jgi:hypothetical protein
MKTNLKLAFTSVLLIASIFLAAFDTPPSPFGQPTVWPKNLDELYQLIDRGQGNWVFKAACPTQPGPSVAWEQVKKIQSLAQDDHNTARLMISAGTVSEIIPSVKFAKTGMLDVTEDKLFNLVIYEFAASDVHTCKPANDKVMIYGAGVQGMFDKLKEYVK